MSIFRKIFLCTFCFLLVSFGLWVCFGTPKALSLSERRELAQPPTPTWETVADGKFFTEVSAFLPDQFPLRESFRKTKAWFQFYVLWQGNSENILFSQGHGAEILTMSEHAERVFFKKLSALQELLQDEKVTVSFVPDKTLYLNTLAPKIDYEKLKKHFSDFSFADITDTLDLSCYYATDPHWRQEKIVPAANRLLSAMGAEEQKSYTAELQNDAFYGVYGGRSALPLSAEQNFVLHHSCLDSATVLTADPHGQYLVKGELYSEKESYDPYDVYLGGGSTVVRLINNEKEDGKILYLFSDSFGRSIAPLFLSSYKEVVFYDLRYISLTAAQKLVPLEKGNDALILYSAITMSAPSSLRAE